MSTPELFQNAKDGKAKFFVQFGGQGAPWYKELSAYYKNPDFKKFFDVALGALDAERSTVEGTVGLPNGIDARKWLDDPESIPSEDYLGCAAVSIPMIQMTQLAHLENLVLQGYSRGDLAGVTLGSAGHSQGLIPASLLAMGLDGDAYLEGVSQYMKYLLYLGVRAQEVYPAFAPSDEETAKSQELGAKGLPTPMVAFLGDTHETVQKLVDEVNSELPESEKIYISLYNSPSNRILSSFRSSLIKFHEKNKAFIDENKLKFVYIKTTCPFHCPLMEAIREPFSKDIERIGFSYPGSALKYPVFSFYDGRNMQEDDELAYNMAWDMAIHPLYWEKSVGPVSKNGDITNIIDFGPGKASQRLTADTLKGMDCETPVLAAGVPKDLKVLLK